MPALLDQGSGHMLTRLSISENKQVSCSPNQHRLQLAFVPGSMLDAEGVEKEPNISLIS